MDTRKIAKAIKETEKRLAAAKTEYKSTAVALRDAQAVVTAAEGRRRAADIAGGRLLHGPVLPGVALETIGKVEIASAQYDEQDRAVQNAEYELLGIRRAHSDAFQRQRHLSRLLQYLRHVVLPEAQRGPRPVALPPQSAGGLTAY